MHTLNSSKVEITTFFLIGIPGMEHVHVSVPICLMYLVAILGNCTTLFMIRTEPSLHAPMYYFLSKLAVSDLSLSLSSLPTMLLIFDLNATGISPSACFAQEFFIHGFTNLESSVLLVMSLFAFWPSTTPWDTAPSSPMPEWPKWIWCSSLKAFSYCSHFLSLLKDWPIVGRAYFLTLTVSIKMSWSLPALTTQSTFSMASLLLSLWWQTVCSLLCSMYSSWRLWWEFDPTRSSSKPSTPVFPTSVLCLSSMCPSSLQLPCTALASSSAQWPWS